MKLLHNVIAACICLLLCAGCRPAQETIAQGNPPASGTNELYPVLEAREIIGKWSFVYFKKYTHVEGQLPVPPAFDVMELSEPDSILLKSWINHQELTGTFEVTFGLLRYRFQTPDKPHTFEHKVGCFLANEGKAMIISTDEAELVYFRSYRIFENEIAGSWHAEINGQQQIMNLSKDGAYAIEPGAITGNYRLWPSRLGNAMTVIYNDPSHGAFTVISLYKLQDNGLMLTPIEGDQGKAEKAVVWKRQ